MILEVAGIGMVYAGRDVQRTEAISEVSFGLEDREFVSVVGPSGCGKTTLLKCMAGLMTPTTGQVRLHGRPVTAPPADLSVVFQDYSRSLLPWLTVSSNVELPLRRRHDRRTRREICDRVTEAVGLAKFRGHYPSQLSGGMQQRVAIARALASEPQVLLLDEPFASVDAQTRAELEDLVLSLRERFDVTMLLVTHDIDEAVYMSERVVVLTHQPSRVRDELAIELPWPRNQVETKVLPGFAALRARVYEEIVGAQKRA